MERLKAFHLRCSNFSGGSATFEVSSEEADLFPRIGFADSEETNVENVPNRFAVLNVLLQSPLPKVYEFGFTQPPDHRTYIWYYSILDLYVVTYWYFEKMWLIWMVIVVFVFYESLVMVRLVLARGKRPPLGVSTLEHRRCSEGLPFLVASALVTLKVTYGHRKSLTIVNETYPTKSELYIVHLDSRK